MKAEDERINSLLANYSTLLENLPDEDTTIIRDHHGRAKENVESAKLQLTEIHK